MLSRDETIQAFKDLALNSSDTAINKGQRLIQQRIKEVLGLTGLSFNYDTAVIPSQANVKSYSMPANCNRVVSASFQLNNLLFPLLIVNSEQEFNRYRVTNFTSNFPRILYVKNNTIYPYPYPADDTIEFQVNFIKRVPDMSFVDVSTTGTVTLGSPTVTGTGFLTTYIGKSLRAADGIWYEIIDVPNSTHITLKQNYAGLTTTGAITIAELVPLPEGFELTPIYLALADYYISDESKEGLYDRFLSRGNDLLTGLKDAFGSTTDSVTGFAADYEQQIPSFFVAP